MIWIELFSNQKVRKYFHLYLLLLGKSVHSYKRMSKSIWLRRTNDGMIISLSHKCRQINYPMKIVVSNESKLTRFWFVNNSTGILEDSLFTFELELSGSARYRKNEGNRTFTSRSVWKSNWCQSEYYCVF